MSFLKKIVDFFFSLIQNKKKEEETILIEKEPDIVQETNLPPALIKKYPERLVTKPKLVIKTSSNLTKKNILGINFTFDKKTYKLFNQEFDSEDYEIIYDDVGCYLCRKNQHNFIEYFHRWLMTEEIEDFAKKYKISTSDTIVHHCNHDHTDNRRVNLKLMTRKDHHNHHKKEKAYQSWEGSREEFEEWYFNHHKD